MLSYRTLHWYILYSWYKYVILPYSTMVSTVQLVQVCYPTVIYTGIYCTVGLSDVILLVHTLVGTVQMVQVCYPIVL